MFEELQYERKESKDKAVQNWKEKEQKEENRAKE